MHDGQNSERLILVSGATGQQGGAVARSLLERGFRVRALTRDTGKPEAQPLAKVGAELVRGDLEKRTTLDQALEGAYGVFSVQNFYEVGYEGEVRQGTTLADAAKAAGVRHSSIARSVARLGKPVYRTSTANGKSSSTNVSQVFLTRSCVQSSSCRTGR